MRPEEASENLCRRDRRIRRRWNQEARDALQDLAAKNVNLDDSLFRLEGLLEYVTEEYATSLYKQRLLWVLCTVASFVAGALIVLATVP